jgi:hypothetical protein
MALTTLLNSKQSSVRLFMDRELPDTTPCARRQTRLCETDVAETLPSPPFQGWTEPSSVLRSSTYFRSNTPRSVSPSWLARLPASSHTAGSKAAERAVAELRRLGALVEPLSGPALERAADCALVCARLEQRFRMGDQRGRDLQLPNPAVGVLGGLEGLTDAAAANAQTRADLVALLEASAADVYSAAARV